MPCWMRFVRRRKPSKVEKQVKNYPELGDLIQMPYGMVLLITSADLSMRKGTFQWFRSMCEARLWLEGIAGQFPCDPDGDGRDASKAK